MQLSMPAAFTSAAAKASPSSVAVAGGLVANSKKRNTLSRALPTDEATFGANGSAPISEPTEMQVQPSFFST